MSSHLLAFCCWMSENNKGIVFDDDEKLYEKLMEYIKLNDLGEPNTVEVEKILKTMDKKNG